MQKNFRNFFSEHKKKLNTLDSSYRHNINKLNINISSLGRLLSNQTNDLPKISYSNLGFYVPYALINSELMYEYLNESSFITNNLSRSTNTGNNIFKWRNVLDNKIKNLIYIYIHILSIPLYPWLDKNITSDINQETIELLLNLYNNNELLPNQIVNNIQISYVDQDIIDFSLNYDYSKCYSLEIYTNKVFLYTRSTKKITDEGYLYVDIDSNDNLNDNSSLNTSYRNKKFSFKVMPINISSSYVYYKGSGQYILKTLNDIQSLDFLTITIYDSSYKPLSNNNVNKNLYNDKLILCDCLENNSSKPSCYCNYIRHPYNLMNQIDISFKIGQVKNELINYIFH